MSQGDMSQGDMSQGDMSRSDKRRRDLPVVDKARTDGPRCPTLLAYRLAVTSRILAAIVGSFLLTPALQAVLIETMPFSEAPPFPQNSLGASLLGFAIQVPIVLWIIHVPSLVRAWTWPLLATVLAYGLAWALMTEALS